MEISKLNNQNNGSNNGILTAKDPLDALRILRTGVIKFDLVVSDVHMPGMDGFELQRWIHQDFQLPVLYSSLNDLHQQTNQTLEILLLVMSGDREASNLCEGSQSGASLFVVKPITTEDLKSIWDFVNQWKKNLAKGKNLISDDSSAKDNEDDTGNKLYEKKSKPKLQITDNEDHNHGKNRVPKDKALLTKKNKLNWTPFLHDKFVRAVQHLGPQGSIPRNIVTKYRIDQEKQSEAEQNPDLFKTLQMGKGGPHRFSAIRNY
ncbi:two-component response regulator ORR25-like [Apium graveolens]|uniref:two-component response regulator ORR25-like n=1 Tax=Apium graveolens TaxID=4045 RepID=UPI003D78FE9B